jgi:hypothetical protein
MMKIWQLKALNSLATLAIIMAASPGLAQVPVDESGELVGTWEAQAADQGTGNEGIPLLEQSELEAIVGPVALYPDDLLAIVLPASTYPLQIVQALRFLEDLKSDPGLEPDENWDDSIVALLNYPEVIELLNEDLDWTWQLGEAVVAQQADVLGAVESFRDSAYVAGNLRSDEYQNVSRDEGIIEITPANDDIIYVPYYEPESVVVYQPQRVYHYYERPYPVYYYPYPNHYAFNRGYFWGVTTAFTIGWASDRLHVYHHSYSGHPYYGRSYRDQWWYRRPSINVHNSVYINNNVHVSSRHYASGDYWQRSRNMRLRHSDQRITRNVHYPSRSTTSRSSTSTRRNYSSNRRDDSRNQSRQNVTRYDARNTARSTPRNENRANRNQTRREPGVRQYVAQEPANRPVSTRREQPRGDTQAREIRQPRRDTQARETRQPRQERQSQQDRQPRQNVQVRQENRKESRKPVNDEGRGDRQQTHSSDRGNARSRDEARRSRN